LFASRVRRSDTVARTGGDEFSVILEEPTSRKEAMHVGQSLIELLNEPLNCGEHTVRIGASVGIAIFPEDAREMQSLCIAADLKMYDAKHEALGDRDLDHARTSRPLAQLEPQTRGGLQVGD
jgi:diguanylate cyclase (GGDEF)-like protein